MHHHLMKKFAVALAFSVSPVIATEVANVAVLAQSLGKTTALEDIHVYDVIRKSPMPELAFDDGRYYFQYPVGEAISLLFRREGYATSQSGVFVVPPEGLTGEYDNISWQAIPAWLWDTARYVIERHTSETMKPGYCQLITTITAKNKTLNDKHQGEPGARVALTSQSWTERRKPHGAVFYFGALAGKPLPIPGLDETSTDGGVVIMNIEPGHVYNITASKPGLEFTTPYFSCNPAAWADAAPYETMLINLSPPNGPTVISELEEA